MRIKDVEAMVDNSPTSAWYGKPFGVILTYTDGHRKRFSDIGLALCASLTISQRKFVKKIQAEIDQLHREAATVKA